MTEQQSYQRTRSFRFEDYNNRRVFLRSYPLNQEPGEDQKSTEQEEEEQAESKGLSQRPIKKVMLSVVTWGEEKFLVLRRVRVKLTVLVIACVPVGLLNKPSAVLIEA